jgi:hypothetical protein
MDRFTKCSGCKALNVAEWTCSLGYPIAAVKVFKPLQECPKPTTDEELEEAPRNEHLPS